MLVVGSDGRGTAYGILELSRLAGVSPWVWWGDVTPMRKERLTLPADYSTFQSAIGRVSWNFLNDEDWSLQPWSWKNFEPSDIKGRIGARTYKEIIQIADAPSCQCYLAGNAWNYDSVLLCAGS